MKLAYVVYKKPTEAVLRMKWAPNRRLASHIYEDLRAAYGPGGVRPPSEYNVQTRPGAFPNKDQLVDWLDEHCGWMKL